MRQNQSRQATVQVHGAQGLEQRNQDNLIRYEHAEQEEREHDLAALELPLREHIPVERAKNGGADGRGDRQDNGIDEVGLEQVDGLTETRPVECGWQFPGRWQADVRRQFERRDERHVGWHEKEQRQNAESPVKKDRADRRRTFHDYPRLRCLYCPMR